MQINAHRASFIRKRMEQHVIKYKSINKRNCNLNTRYFYLTLGRSWHKTIKYLHTHVFMLAPWFIVPKISWNWRKQFLFPISAWPRHNLTTYVNHLNFCVNFCNVPLHTDRQIAIFFLSNYSKKILLVFCMDILILSIIKA